MNNKNKRHLVIGCLIFAAVLITAIAAVEIFTGLSRKKIDTSEGLALIKQAESSDPAAIETKIQKLEERDVTGETETRSIKERFISAAVMGDSIMEGFSEYDILNASSVVSGIGVELEDQIAKLKEVNPKTIFLAYSANDILDSKGDTEAYIKQYRKRIDAIQEAVPEANIFVNSILPVEKSAAAKESQFKRLEKYNDALREMCDKLQIAYIDNSALSVAAYYEQDGIHFKSGLYSVWADAMAEVASL